MLALVFMGDVMENIKLYEVDNDYINYLSQFAPHLFLNKQPHQSHERKYIGVVLHINDTDYFAPLSSFKPKHSKMPNRIDFIKIKNYAVINLNNMFPVIDGVYTYVDINSVRDIQYKNLLLAEYRFIKSIQNNIRKNALILYKLKVTAADKTPLTERCNDFKLLEEKAAHYNL